MKLVELVARELSEWTAGKFAAVQDPDSDGTVWFVSSKTGLEFYGSEWKYDGYFEIAISRPSQRAEDYATAIVTRAQWQAERDRQNGGEWKRARGRKPKHETEKPQRMEVRHRDGDITKGWTSQSWNWSHNDGCPSADIMAWRIISQPQEEEVEVNVFVGKDVKIEYAYAQEGVEPEHLEWKTMGTAKIDSICDLGSTEAKTDQIDGPIKWRDEVTELNAYIEKYTRERDALIERLASEGFALIPDMTTVMGFAPISLPFGEWEPGDFVTSKVDYNHQFTKGKKYKVTGTNMSLGEKRVSVESDDKGKANGWLANHFEFHSRP